MGNKKINGYNGNVTFKFYYIGFFRFVRRGERFLDPTSCGILSPAASGTATTSSKPRGATSMSSATAPPATSAPPATPTTPFPSSPPPMTTITMAAASHAAASRSPITTSPQASPTAQSTYFPYRRGSTSTPSAPSPGTAWDSSHAPSQGSFCRTHASCLRLDTVISMLRNGTVRK